MRCKACDEQLNNVDPLGELCSTCLYVVREMLSEFSIQELTFSDLKIEPGTVLGTEETGEEDYDL